VSGLESTFDGQVEFILLDWDDKSLNEQRGELGITDRTQYVLVDPSGEVVKQWYGILNEGTVEGEISDFLTG
jgi:hypothetical protein